MDEMRLDDELRAALAVDPSPEFVARVRTRVASEPPPSRWRLAIGNAVAAFRQTGMMAPVAASAVVVLAVAVALRPEPERVQPIQVEVPVAPPVSVPPPADISPRPAGGSRRAPLAVTARRVAPPRRGIEMQVVISQDEKRAFEALLTAVQTNTMPVRVVAEGENLEEPLMPAPLEVDQFTIAPLQMTRLE